MGKDLEKREANAVGFKHLKINKIIDNDKWLFLMLDNGQNILTDGKELYDVSKYLHFSTVLEMNGRKCGVFMKGYTTYVVDLKTSDVLFENSDAYSVFKEDDKTLSVITHDSGKRLYDIDKKAYLLAPDKYVFDSSLGNDLYVFCEDRKYREDYLKYKRIIMNLQGEILISDISGYIHLNKTHLVISETDELKIVGLDDKKCIGIKSLKKDDQFLSRPDYYKGYILTIEKNCVKLYDTYLNVLKEFKVDGLEVVKDSEWQGSVLKILVPHEENGKEIGKHIFVNLKNGKVLSYIRIEGYPHWNPTTFIGTNVPNFERTDYYFYNEDFELVRKMNGDFYESINDEKKLFLVRTQDENRIKKELLNSGNGNVTEVDYDLISYNTNRPYGWGVNEEKQTMDFFDENLNVVISNFDYNKYDLSLSTIGDDFGYFIVNDYLCVTKHVVDDYGRSRYRTIIYRSSNGEEIMDSYKHRCYPLGNFIQIIKDGESKFLNTFNGEIGDLEIGLPTKEDGEIDFNKMIDVNKMLRLSDNRQLEQPSNLKKR
jgi:hypothetical protein